MFTVFSTFPEMALAATKIHKASKAQRGSCRDGPVSEGLATQHKDLHRILRTLVKLSMVAWVCKLSASVER